MNKIVPLLIALFFTACGDSIPKQDHSVTWHGALMNIMHKGDLSAHTELSELNGKKHVYALGALEDLQGEILILNSEVFISKNQEGNVSISSSLDNGACLLVQASVSDWEETDIPEKVHDYEQLEAHIEAAALLAGIDTEQPFPFLLNGGIEALDWHVIDWPRGDTDHSHEKHIRSGPSGKLLDEEVTVLGFYSKKHHAVFTHHTTNMHLHFKTKDATLSGHVDDLHIQTGMSLSLPSIN